jgi:hypothetical protein
MSRVPTAPVIDVSTNVAAVSVTDIAFDVAPVGPVVTVLPVAAPKKLVIAYCRDVTKDEQKTFSQNFKDINWYNASTIANNDLSTITFDLLLVDLRKDSHHMFLRTIRPQCKAAGIKLIVLKRSGTNAKPIAEKLEATVHSFIPSLTGDDFIRFLENEALPKLEGRVKTFLKFIWSKVFGCASVQ